MALKIICDCCGEEIQPDEEFATVVSRKKKHSIQDVISQKAQMKPGGGKFVEESSQICKECAKAIEETMLRLKEEANKNRKVDD